MIPEEVRLAVKRGSHELDQQYPGWHQAIHLESLDMSQPSSCVLAYVSGWLNLGQDDGYYTMMDVMAPRDEYSRDDQWDWAKDHGFMEDDRTHIEADWETYDLAWTQLIEERNE